MEISSLGIKVDSGPVDEGAKKLDQFSAAAEKAEKAGAKVGDGVRKGAGVAVEATKDMEAAMTRASVKGNLIGQTIADGIGTAVRAAMDAYRAIEQLISQVAEFQDLSDMTGAAASGIASLKTSADVANVSLSNVARMMTTLDRNLARVNDESRAAGAGLAFLGISLDEIRRLKPDEQLRLIADRLKGVEDGAGKAALISTLFGISAGNAAKFMKELGQEEERNTQLTEDMIRQMDDYNDAIAKTNSQLNTAAMVLASEFAPALSSVRNFVKNLIIGLFDLDDGVGKLAGNDAIRQWSLKVVEGFVWIIEKVEQVISAFKMVYTAVDSVLKFADLGTQAIDAALTFNPDKMREKWAAAKQVWRDGDAEIARLGGMSKTREAWNKTLDQMVIDQYNFYNKTEEGAKKNADAFKSIGDKKNKDAEKAARELQRQIDFENSLISKLGGLDPNFAKQWDALAMAYGRGRISLQDLITLQKELLDKQPAIKKSHDDERKAIEELITSYEKVQQELTDYNAKHDEMIRKRQESQRDLNIGLQSEGELLKAETSMLGADNVTRGVTIELLRIEIDRREKLRKLAEDPDTTLADKNLLGAGVDEEALLRRSNAMAKAYSQRMTEALQEVDGVAKQLWDSLWEKGENTFKKLGNIIKRELLDNLYKMVVRPWIVNIVGNMTGMGGGAGGAAAALLGGGGGGGNGILGMAQNAYSGYSALTGGSAATTGTGFLGQAAAGWAGATGAGAGVVGTGFATSAAGAGAAFEGYMAAAGYAAAEGATVAGVAGGMASGTAAGAGAAASAGLAAIPVAGWIALAALAVWSIFGSDGGGPKIGGTFGENMIGKENHELDQQAMMAAQSATATFQKVNAALGGNGGNITFGMGMVMDPQGDAPSFVHTAASRDGSRFAENVNWNVGREKADVEKAMMEQTVDIMIQALQASGIDQAYLDYFHKISDGLDAAGKSAAFETLAAVGKAVRSMDDMGPAFAKVSAMSVAAKIHLLELAGGAEVLSANIGVYAQNFLTAEEKRANMVRMVTKTLQEGGVVGITEQQIANMTNQGFRAMVEGLNMTTESGQKAFVTLMAVSGAMAELTRELPKDVVTLEEAQDRLNDAYQKQKGLIEGVRDTALRFVDSMRSLRSSLLMGEGSTLTPQQKYEQAWTDYTVTMSQAKAGDQGAAERFQEVARQLLDASRAMYAGGENYQRDFQKVLGDTDQMQMVAQAQYDTASAQLDALDESVKLLIDIRDGVMGVEDAISLLQRVKAGEVVIEGVPLARGMNRVPYDNFPARLHAKEAVLTESEADEWRGKGQLIEEVRALRKEVSALRKENREDAGAGMSAVFDATETAARIQTEATMRAARLAAYDRKEQSSVLQ